MRDKQIANSQVRESFKTFYINAYKPQLKLLSKEIGIAYYDFTKWIKGTVDYGPTNLSKVTKFLERVL